MARKKNAPTAAAYNSAFPRTLRTLMENRVPSVTQSELGKAIGKTRQAVGYYSDGSSSPDWETLVKIADFFNVSVDYLLGRTRIISPEMTETTAVPEGPAGVDEPEAGDYYPEASAMPDTSIQSLSLNFTARSWDDVVKFLARQAIDSTAPLKVLFRVDVMDGDEA